LKKSHSTGKKYTELLETHTGINKFDKEEEGGMYCL